MTTVTDSDIKEIKDAITSLGKQIADNDRRLTEAILSLTKQIADNERRLTEAILSLTKQIADVATEVKTTTARIDITNAKIDATNTKIDGLDKRLSILEAVYQRFFNVMIGFLGTTLAGIALKFIWDNFKFVAQ